MSATHTSTSNATSTITAPPVANGKATTKAKLNGTTAPKAKLTAAEAVEVGFTYGETMAGQDGLLTVAFTTFKANEKVIDDIANAVIEGYYVRKLSINRDVAKGIMAKAKYNDKNPEKNTTNNRTKAEQNIMAAANMLVSRAKRLAGITTKAPATAEAEARRATAEAEAKAKEDRLIKADAIVNPSDEVDVFDALNRLVLTMKSLQNKYAAKLVDDRGSEWRNWLAAAPR